MAMKALRIREDNEVPAIEDAPVPVVAADQVGRQQSDRARGKIIVPGM